MRTKHLLGLALLIFLVALPIVFAASSPLGGGTMGTATSTESWSDWNFVTMAAMGIGICVVVMLMVMAGFVGMEKKVAMKLSMMVFFIIFITILGAQFGIAEDFEFFGTIMFFAFGMVMLYAMADAGYNVSKFISGSFEGAGADIKGRAHELRERGYGHAARIAENWVDMTEREMEDLKRLEDVTTQMQDVKGLETVKEVEKLHKAEEEIEAMMLQIQDMRSEYPNVMKDAMSMFKARSMVRKFMIKVRKLDQQKEMMLKAELDRTISDIKRDEGSMKNLQESINAGEIQPAEGKKEFKKLRKDIHEKAEKIHLLKIVLGEEHKMEDLDRMNKYLLKKERKAGGHRLLEEKKAKEGVGEEEEKMEEAEDKAKEDEIERLSKT